VKRRLNNAGLFGRRPVKKPLISSKNRIARVDFAKKHQNRSAADWSKVLWSDVSKFLLFGSDEINYFRRGINQRYDPKHQLPTVKHGGGSIMVCEWFSCDGLGPIHRIEGIMDQFVYKNIISDVMLPHAKNEMARGWVFQQDIDPKHTVKSVKEFFRAKKIHVLD
jgi:Transposase